MRVFGHTLGGTAVESGDASFPIQVCYGCLVKFPPEASSSATSPNCSQPPASGSSLSLPCRMGQDELSTVAFANRLSAAPTRSCVIRSPRAGLATAALALLTRSNPAKADPQVTTDLNLGVAGSGTLNCGGLRRSWAGCVASFYGDDVVTRILGLAHS